MKLIKKESVLTCIFRPFVTSNLFAKSIQFVPITLDETMKKQNKAPISKEKLWDCRKNVQNYS